jgi:4-diphosphocytidyl-2-C-methyl-D-erythritol kinase
MSTRVRSHSKINLGLAIGPVRPDGFHALTTVYQTLELHDLVTVEANLSNASGQSHIEIACNHEGVPTDSRNTVWKMAEKALAALGVTAEVHIEIDKRLPVQGGLGAGSANAVAALLGLEQELGLSLPAPTRLALAAEVGSDVPLFLIGGAVLGLGRGEEVYPLPDFPSYECVVAVPAISVSTPQAFRDWDARVAVSESATHLTPTNKSDILSKLSRSIASSWSLPHSSGVSPQRGDLAESPLLALVRTGIENDFESVVFPQYPLLGDIKRTLAVLDPENPEQSAVYAAVSGSGSAVFGLYVTTKAADSAQRRLERMGVTALRTRTLGRAEYWEPGLRAQGLAIR